MKAVTYILLTLSFLSLLSPAPARAQWGDGTGLVATYWQGTPGKPGRWFDPLNWTAGVPTEGTTAYINNGGTAILHEHTLSAAAAARELFLGGKRPGTIDHISGSMNVLGGLWLGHGGWGPGTYNLSGGRFSAGHAVIGSGAVYYDWTNLMPRYSGRFRQTNGSSHIRGTLYVGHQGYTLTTSETTEPALLDEAGLLAGADTAYRYRPGALYELAGGDLTASQTYVGYGGKGKFVQSDGTNDVTYGLYVGGGTNWIQTDTTSETAALGAYWWYYAEGTYHMAGGRLSAGSVHVGQHGRGRFVHSGGDIAVKGTLQVGGNWWWWRPLDTNDTSDANADGMTSIFAPDYYLPADGSYHLSRGELATGATEIGVGGYGRFVQSGGAHQTEVLRIGGPWYSPLLMAPDGSKQDPTGTTTAGDPSVDLWPYSPVPVSSGSYTLSGGKLLAGRVTLGTFRHYWDRLADPAGATASDGDFAPWPAATFTQTGGHVTVTGSLDVTDSSYRLLDGTLTAGSVNLTGWYNIGHSQFRQSGGICRIAGSLNVGAEVYTLDGAPDATGELSDPYPYYLGWQTFALSGGQLSAQHVRIGGRGKALLIQTGGEMTVAGRLDITGINATYDIRHGVLRAGTVRVGPGVLSPTNTTPGNLLHIGGWGARVTITDRLVFEAGGRFTAERGSRIAMNGADLVNHSTSPAALAGLDSVRLVFSIGPEDDLEWETYEVAGEDLGFVRHGWSDNFQLHTLQLGGVDVAELRLIDDFDNQPDFDGHEALYVRYLVIGPGSKIDLNGLHLYYLQSKIHEDAQILGGTAEQAIAADWILSGDANFDGVVDEIDLSVLLGNWDQPADWTTGDFDGSGVASDSDLSALLSNWTVSAPSAAQQVPEPATLSLLVAGGLALMRRRRR